LYDGYHMSRHRYLEWLVRI